MLDKDHSLSKSTKVERLSAEEVASLSQDLTEGWNIIDGDKLVREYSFKNFKGALAFTNQVGAIAEEFQHHPDILLQYAKVRVSLSTHSVKGLSTKDFMLADKIEAEYRSF